MIIDDIADDLWNNILSYDYLDLCARVCVCRFLLLSCFTLISICTVRRFANGMQCAWMTWYSLNVIHPNIHTPHIYTWIIWDLKNANVRIVDSKWRLHSSWAAKSVETISYIFFGWLVRYWCFFLFFFLFIVDVAILCLFAAATTSIGVVLLLLLFLLWCFKSIVCQCSIIFVSSQFNANHWLL